MKGVLAVLIFSFLLLSCSNSEERTELHKEFKDGEKYDWELYLNGKDTLVSKLFLDGQSENFYQRVKTENGFLEIYYFPNSTEIIGLVQLNEERLKNGTSVWFNKKGEVKKIEYFKNGEEQYNSNVDSLWLKNY